ncbi:MAG: exosortase/archaeosortase family protein [Candidatus Omnitrophica bacterium]|nr:exosortase/archaeosortase family protein [Candidatus Omnitrophota bacterium]
MRYIRLITGVGLVAVLISVLYGHIFVWLHERFTAADTYYSHGFLVPLVCLVLSALKHNALRRERPETGRPGLAVIIIALGLHLFSTLADVFFVSGFSLVLLIAGIILFLFGGKITRILAFPLFFLVFMIPVPLVAVNTISVPLKLFVTRAVVVLMEFVFRIPVRQEGFQIFFPNNASVIVENPCSGLRSVIVLIALGSIFAYLLKARLRKRVLLFILSLPVAILSNVVRVITLSLCVHIYGAAFTQRYIHDASGYLMFIVAFSGMILLWRVLQCKDSGSAT